jgi:uncharacterized membrane protein
MPRTTAMIAIAIAVLAAQPARACFFCEEGAKATMYFVGTFFGLFFLGMLMLFLAYWRAGGFKASNRTELRVLQAEGIQEENHEHA